MRISRRSLLAGTAATVAVAALPAQAGAFRFAVPRRMRCLAYAFADPWRVDYSYGEPYWFVHEASGVMFPPDCFEELDKGIVPLGAIWRDYEPPWPLTASNMEPGEHQPRVYDLPPPALNTAMKEGGIGELRELCRAVQFITLWCRHQAQPTKSDATILLRRQRQLLVVDMDGHFRLRAAVVDDAAEHVAARDPLIAIFVIVDLFLPRRYFGDRLVPGGQESFLSREDAVEHVDDFTVRHSRDVRSDSETRPGNAGVGIVDNRVVSLTRYPHLIDYGASRLPQAHLRPPRRDEYSRETWQRGKRLANACTVE